MASELTADSLSIGYDNAGFHNCIYRGKYLGSAVTAEQYAQIGAGTFKDLFIGDYWAINNINWRIAAFDYHLGKGDIENNTHHIVIVPDSNLLTTGAGHYMNTTGTTTGGYKGSGYYSGTNSDSSPNTSKASCKTIINNAFGNGHIYTYREQITDDVTNGGASSLSWEDCDVECMSETMIYGRSIMASEPKYETANEVTQLPLFSLNPKHIINRDNWWFCSIRSATDFARLGAYGGILSDGAGVRWVGVRPAFAIKA